MPDANPYSAPIAELPMDPDLRRVGLRVGSWLGAPFLFVATVLTGSLLEFPQYRHLGWYLGLAFALVAYAASVAGGWWWAMHVRPGLRPFLRTGLAMGAAITVGIFCALCASGIATGKLTYPYRLRAAGVAELLVWVAPPATAWCFLLGATVQWRVRALLRRRVPGT